jgi:hypothetical protein
MAPWHGGRISVNRVEQYRKFAADCMKMANQTHDDEQKKMLTGMAEAWLMLARKRAEKVADGLKSESGN